MDDMTTYNYCCIEDGCNSTTVHIKCMDKDKPLCEHCKRPMKRLGVCTYITHIGTREAKIHK